MYTHAHTHLRYSDMSFLQKPLIISLLWNGKCPSIPFVNIKGLTTFSVAVLPTLHVYGKLLESEIIMEMLRTLTVKRFYSILSASCLKPLTPLYIPFWCFFLFVQFHLFND